MKKILSVLLILTITVTLAACGGNDDGIGKDGLITLTYWNIFTGPDGQVMKEIVEEFNELNEGEIRINTQTLPANDFYEKLNVVVPQGRAPDIAIMHLEHIPRYANDGAITPIDDLLANTTIKGEDYIKSVWDASTFDGKHYAVPLDVHPIVLYYNKDLLDEKGIEVPTTYEELIAAAKQFDNTDGKVWGMPMSAMWPSQLLYTSSLYQNNGKDIDDDAINPAFNTNEGYTALKRITDLIHVEKISPTNVAVDEDLALFRQGNAAFHINGIWMLNGLKESGVNFGTASVETLFGDTPAIWAGSHNFVLPKQKNPNPLKQEAAMKFIQYVSENSLRWANAGQVPANNNVREMDEYKQLEYHNTIGNVENIKFPPASITYMDAFHPMFSRVTEAMLNKDADIRALLQDAEDEAIQRVKEALE